MNRALRIILIVILFIGFFEIGLFSSYTIVTSEVPDVKGLIDLQINTVTGIFHSNDINNVIIKDPSSINITNKVDTAMAMANAAKVDGVSVPSMNASTQQESENGGPVNITINALAFANPSSVSNSTYISTTPTYMITAVALANITSSEVIVDTSSIKITSIMNINDNKSTTTKPVNINTSTA